MYNAMPLSLCVMKLEACIRFKAVGTATGTHQTVTRHNIQCPDTLVVHIGRLKGAIAGIGQSNGHIIGHRRFRVNRIFRRLVQKVAAGSQQQYWPAYIVNLLSFSYPSQSLKVKV